MRLLNFGTDRPVIYAGGADEIAAAEAFRETYGVGFEQLDLVQQIGRTGEVTYSRQDPSSSWDDFTELVGAAFTGWRPVLIAAGFGGVNLGGELGAELGIPEAVTEVKDVWDDFLEDTAFGDIWGDVQEVLSGVEQVVGVVQQVQDIFSSPSAPAPAPAPRAAGFLPAVFQQGAAMDDGYNGYGMQPVAIGGPVATAGIWLGSLLARTFGRAMTSAVITGANGVRVRLNQLWPLVRRYGPQVVAGGMGWTLAELGGALARAPTTGARKRRRGISYADVKRTRRTIKQLRSLTRLAGIRTGGGGYRGFSRRRYRHSHRHAH